MTTLYVCHFTKGLTAPMAESTEGIEAFSNGFWVNADGEYVELEKDGKFWIPPHQILFIEKVETP